MSGPTENRLVIRSIGLVGCALFLIAMQGCAPPREAVPPPLAEEEIVAPAPDASKNETWNRGDTLTIGKNNADPVVDRSRPSARATAATSTSTTVMEQPRMYGGYRSSYGVSRGGYGRGFGGRTAPIVVTKSSPTSSTAISRSN